MSTSSLCVLPIELLHRIIDCIDTESVFFSFRNVCKRFYTITNTYNQYQLDFHFITKPRFCFLRHLIQPKNVISLVISDGHRTSGQIKLFLSLFELCAFTRLRSLTLIQTLTSDSIEYLKHISVCPLVSLSIDYRDSWNSAAEHKELFSSTLEKLNNLRKLDLKVTRLIINTIKWPVQCSIRHVTFTGCTIEKSIYEIFLYFPYLETLLLQSVSISNDNEDSTSTMKIESKLKSLIIENYPLSMDLIISILSLTPSLIHLKLIGLPTISEFALNGHWWAELFVNKLLELKRFEFFFDKRINHQEEFLPDTESIISSFQTSFWLEKQWYIACNYYKNIRKLELYSIPICKPNISYEFTTEKISCFNSTNITPYIMDNVRSLSLSMIPSTAVICDNNLQLSDPLFSNITKLTLRITNEFSNDSINYLSKLIDFSHLYTLSLTLDLNQQSFQIVKTSMNNLLNQASNIQSIKLRSLRSAYLIEYLQTICSMMSNQVKHFTVDIDHIREMQLILYRYENFSSITFNWKTYCLPTVDDIMEVLTKKNRDFIYNRSHMYTDFWFGK